MRDTTGKFDRIGLHVIDRHVLEPIVQIGLKPGMGGTVGEKDGVVNCVKGSRKQGSHCLLEICVNRCETLRILRQWHEK